MGSELPPASEDVVVAGPQRQTSLEKLGAGRPLAILEPTGAIMQIDAVIAGSLPAGEPRRQFVWDLLLWDEATRELLRRHVDAIASGSDGPHELHVQSTGPDGPADLTLRSLQADNGNVRAIIVEATGIADPASDGQEMVPRQVVEDMAHQLNNALASILGNLELIERRSQDSEAVLARIPRAREALDRAFTLIQGMRK